MYARTKVNQEESYIVLEVLRIEKAIVGYKTMTEAPPSAVTRLRVLIKM